jgi:hypothetical protein
MAYIGKSNTRMMLGSELSRLLLGAVIRHSVVTNNEYRIRGKLVENNHLKSKKKIGSGIKIQVRETECSNGG